MRSDLGSILTTLLPFLGARKMGTQWSEKFCPCLGLGEGGESELSRELENWIEDTLYG